MAALTQLAKNYNLLIGQAQAKVNNIFVEYRLSGQPLAAEKFLLEFKTEGSKDDFVRYFYHKISERHRKGKILDNTRRKHAFVRALKGLR